MDAESFVEEKELFAGEKELFAVEKELFESSADILVFLVDISGGGLEFQKYKFLLIFFTKYKVTFKSNPSSVRPHKHTFLGYRYT